MQIATLMIGRGGSSLMDKNILPIEGVPLLLWGAAAATRSRHITRFYVSSDDEKILTTAARAGYKPIRRPAELASATAQSSDAVKHAFEMMEKDGEIDILVVQHANVGTITESMIDQCIDLLLENPAASSVVPAHEKAEYHPMRAKRVMPDGTLNSFVDSGAVSANRQDLPTAVFFDHSFWVLRGRKAVFDENGQPPWPCMGSTILPFLTEGCFDVHTLEDLETTAQWLKDNKVALPQF